MTDKSVSDYGEFLRQKSQGGADSGFTPVWMPDFLFDFQRELVEWAVRKGALQSSRIADLAKPRWV